MRRLALLSAVMSLVSAGCLVGDPQPWDPNRPPPGGDSPDAGEDPGPGPDAEPAECEPAQTILPNGNHNAGQNCQTCHNGTQAPLWTIAGTLYDSPLGTAPVAGATILVRDANGVELKLVTATNGNFYTQEPVTFPVTVAASKCPDTQRMTGQPEVGACNSCHTGQGQPGRIHLP